MKYCCHFATDLHTTSKFLGVAIPRGRRAHGASDRVVAAILIARLRLIQPNVEFRVASITIIMRHYRGSGGYS